jgi:hypothetical protein
MTFADKPRAHADPAFLAAKIARLDEPHVKPLNDLVRAICKETGGEVPWFDPDTGGVDSRALLLHEAPGRRARARTGSRGSANGSGIISLDNNDVSAANSWCLYQEAGLPRELVVPWNIVPWYLGSAVKIRAAKKDDVAEAQPYLAWLIALLPGLRIVVALGGAARDGWLRYLTSDDSCLLPTLACPHPGAQSINPNPQNRETIRRVFTKTAAMVRD